MVAGGTRIRRGVEEDEDPALLIGIEASPEERGEDPHRKIGDHEPDPLPARRAHPRDHGEEEEEPPAPDPGTEGEDETQRRTRRISSSATTPRPEEHREVDADEDDPRPEVGLRHDQQPRHPTTSAEGTSARSDVGAARDDESTRASIRTTAIFASSEGCPSRTPPMASQLLVLAAVPAPLPDHQEGGEHHEGDAVDGHRDRVDESHREARDAVPQEDPEEHPEELRAPEPHDEGGDIGLPRGVDHRHAERGERGRDGHEGPVGGEWRAAHHSARHLGQRDDGPLEVPLHDARGDPRRTRPLPPNSSITATTICGASAGA